MILKDVLNAPGWYFHKSNGLCMNDFLVMVPDKAQSPMDCFIMYLQDVCGKKSHVFYPISWNCLDMVIKPVSMKYSATYEEYEVKQVEII